MKLVIYLLFLTALTGCLNLNIPEFVTLYEDKLTIIETTTDIGSQTVYKDQVLSPYIINGQHSYCSEIYSQDMRKERCFTGTKNLMTRGMDPRQNTWHDLKKPFTVKKVDKQITGGK